MPAASGAPWRNASTCAGSSSKRIPDRKDALALVRIVDTLADAKAALGPDTRVWVTAARTLDRSLGWADARSALRDGPPVLLVFGTSWGLAPSVTDAADAVVAPIDGGHGWNHLSVRAACAIALDRLRAPAA